MSTDTLLSGTTASAGPDLGGDSLTFDKLLRTVAEVNATRPKFDTVLASDGFANKALRHSSEYVVGVTPEQKHRRETVYGFGVRHIPTPPIRRPALKISEDFAHCSPEFRAQWNAWALERFGTVEVCYLMDTSVLAELSVGIKRDLDKRVARMVWGI